MSNIKRVVLFLPALVWLSAFNAQAGVDYLIITTDALKPTFQTLADHRAAFDGFATEVRTVSSITGAYGGVDTQAKIRACITDYFTTQNLQYVVLGGDNTVVPTRSCKVSSSGYTETNMPTDLYYSGLDGTWDENGNGVYGEADTAAGDEGDLAYDVVVGRIPVETASQAAGYINKVISYDNNPPLSIARKFIMSGNEAWDKYTDASRPSDLLNDGHLQFADRNHPAASDVEIWVRRAYRDNVQAKVWSATTLGCLFDSLTSWDTSTAGNYAASSANMKTRFSEGWNFSLNFTHGNTTVIGAEGDSFSSSTAASMTGMMIHFYTGACLSGAFDKAEPSLSEAMLRNPNGGCLVYLGCSRYGWGSPGSTVGGPSAAYMTSWLTCVFGNRTPVSGKAFADHKQAKAGNCASNGANRWIQFGLNFQGDPAIKFIGIDNSNNVPIANPQGMAAALGRANATTLTGRDVDGDALTYSIVTQPTQGTLSGTGPAVTYTPAANCSGSDSFTFKVTDSKGASSANAMVSIMVITASGGPLGYTWRATEGQTVAFANTVDLAYGANGFYKYKYGVGGSLAFDSGTFGGDPVVGTVKAGYYKDVTQPTACLLTVNGGSGDGRYNAGTVVYNVVADAAPAGQMFDKWTGATANLSYVDRTSTTVTMPAAAVSVTATYATIRPWPQGSGAGTISREWWTGISGKAVSNLTGNANFPNLPSGTDLRALFEAPTDWADNYGTRMRGYLHPPVSGTYTFWIASDDGSELWLSSNADPANKVRIAWVDKSTGSRDWWKYTSQQSAGIPLTGGQIYYIEALQKENTGGDNLAVSWKAGAGYSQDVIAGQYLSSITQVPTTYSLTVTSGTGTGSYTAGAAVNIAAAAAPAGQVFDKWVVNSGSPAMANVNSASTTLTMPAGAAAVAATYIVPKTPCYNAWKEAAFKTEAERNDPAVSGEQATPAHDGITNLMKYALALEPKVCGTADLPKSSRQDGYLAISYRKNKQAADLVYTVQATASLAAGVVWSEASTVVSQVDMGDYWLVTVQDNVPYAGQPIRFMRLRVSH